MSTMRTKIERKASNSRGLGGEGLFFDPSCCRHARVAFPRDSNSAKDSKSMDLPRGEKDSLRLAVLALAKTVLLVAIVALAVISPRLGSSSSSSNRQVRFGDTIHVSNCPIEAPGSDCSVSTPALAFVPLLNTNRGKDVVALETEFTLESLGEPCTLARLCQEPRPCRLEFYCNSTVTSRTCFRLIKCNPTGPGESVHGGDAVYLRPSRYFDVRCGLRESRFVCDVSDMTPIYLHVHP
ncbi:hypothetical protein [Mollivirus kamchatka]|nr:hypothetical protein [Mollivirus kamchatka]